MQHTADLCHKLLLSVDAVLPGPHEIDGGTTTTSTLPLRTLSEIQDMGAG